MAYIRTLYAWLIYFFGFVFCIISVVVSTPCVAVSSQHDATIVIEGDKPIKRINRNIFGISLAKLYRQQWRHPVDFNSAELKALLEELSPTFISLDNTQLGFPFYLDSTGEKSKRISTLETLQRMKMPKVGLVKQLLHHVEQDVYYNQGQSPHKNYDDLLQYYGSLKSSTAFAIRIPIFFTDVQGKYSALSHKLEPASGVDLIRYLNDPVEDSTFGRLRDKNGREEPYGVQYIVLGNELWSNYSKGSMTIETIAGQIRSFANEIKSIYPNIKVGINLVDDSFPHNYLKPNAKNKYKSLIDYNDLILGQVNGYIDFVTFHTYGGLGTEDLNKSFTSTQWQFILSLSYFKSRYNVPGKHASIVGKYNRDISISVDEFSGPTSTLGGAIYNADYIIHMLENSYDYAAGWSLGIMEPDNHFGFIGVNSTSGNDSFYRKPNFYTLKLFSSHMRGDMVSYNIDSPTYSTKAIAWEKYYDWPVEMDIPSLSIVSSRQGNKIYAIIVNRNIEQDINAKIVVNGVGVVENVKLSILTGNSLDSTQVEMIERSQTIESNSLDLVLKRHSVVAIEFSPALP